MSTTVYACIYPKECNNPKIIPYLSCDGNDFDTNPEFPGKYLSQEFFKKSREYGTYNEINDCIIFSDYSKLLEFAGLQCVPDELTDYIMTLFEKEPDGIFVIWLR